MRTVLRGAPLPDRFQALREVRSEAECWRWLGHIDKDGYGRIDSGDGHHGAHRLAWQMATGREWPRGMVAMHACDNRWCVNPAHIRPGTIAENNADAKAKGRHAHGTRHPHARLNDQSAAEILRRRLAGENAQELAREFGVTDRLVYLIAARKKWSHIPLAVPESTHDA